RARRDTAAIKRRDQRGPFGCGARPPRRIVAAGRRAAIDMQTVLYGEVFEIAQPGVDAAQRLVGRGGLDTGLASEAGALRRLDDQGGEPFASPPVEAFGLRIFVDQPLELAGVAR